MDQFKLLALTLLYSYCVFFIIKINIGLQTKNKTQGRPVRVLHDG